MYLGVVQVKAVKENDITITWFGTSVSNAHSGSVLLREGERVLASARRRQEALW